MSMTKSQAGRLGGLATVKRHGSDHMRSIGSRGGAAFWIKYLVVPLGTSNLMIVNRSTNQPTGRTMNGYFLSHKE